MNQKKKIMTIHCRNPGYMKEMYCSKDTSWREHDYYHTNSNGETSKCHGMEERKCETSIRC